MLPVGQRPVADASLLSHVTQMMFRNVVEPYSAVAIYRCPCCRNRTLHERGGDEICASCFGHDDGQDDHDAAEVRGGPNYHPSLADARENYRRIAAADPRMSAHVQTPEDESAEWPTSASHPLLPPRASDPPGCGSSSQPIVAGDAGNAAPAVRDRCDPCLLHRAKTDAGRVRLAGSARRRERSAARGLARSAGSCA